MKRIVWPCVLGLTLLVGCQNTEPKVKVETAQSTKLNQKKEAATKDTAFPYPNLLSEGEQSYSLLVIGEQDQNNPIEKNTMITDKVSDILSLPELQMAQKAYPKLKIKSDPDYILFDHAGVIYQTKNLNDLAAYLEQNIPK